MENLHNINMKINEVKISALTQTVKVNAVRNIFKPHTHHHLQNTLHFKMSSAFLSFNPLNALCREERRES